MPLLGELAHTWWVPLVYVLILGHITNICVTLYLHRSMTHEGVVFHPVVAHAMRFWLWLTTGMKTKEWVAVHRKHHAFADREGDPHSPEVEGFWAIALAGVFFYRKAVLDRESIEKYGYRCPDDAVERRLYTGISFAGILIVMPILDVLLFGPLVGLIVWSCTAIWVPIMGNIINGVGHALGYRNFDTRDHSHNIYPFGFWIVGEELHNNHHADPRSAKFTAHWWEFDIGWIYIKALKLFRLADVVYARSVSAAEFAEKYYGRAKDAAAVAAESARGRALGVAEAARDAALGAAEAARGAAMNAAGAAKGAAMNAAGAAKGAAEAAKDAAVSAAEAAAKAATPPKVALD
jgi:stearoyl-CoA desaturase (delta-9 desaturase)